MARPELQRLYAALRDSAFSFLPKGELHLSAIYAVVARRHQNLCDDDYLCRMNCSSGHDQPEWQHVVRKALHTLKERGVVSRGGGKGLWRFR